MKMIKQKIVVESEGKCGSGYAQYECLGGGLYRALSCMLSRASDSEWLCVAHDVMRDLTMGGRFRCIRFSFADRLHIP